MKKKQIKNLAIALSLTAALGTGATLALLTAQTETVTNTFTVGKNLQASDLLLNEADVKQDPNTGKYTVDESKPRTQTLDFVGLMQGDKLPKDPTVQIKADAAKCYMFVHITGLDALKAKGEITVDWKGDSWEKYVVSGEESGKLDGYYYYTGTGTTNNVLDPASEKLKDEKGSSTGDGKGFMDLDALFETVTVGKDAKIYEYDEEGNLKKLPEIVAKACAVQAQNVEDIDAAFKALPTDTFK